MKKTKKFLSMIVCAAVSISSMIGLNTSASENDTTARLLSVPFCEQETNYYCAAATFQQVYAYYRGINNALSQSTIASLIGVTPQIGLGDYNDLTYWLNRYLYQELEYEWKFRGSYYDYGNSSEMRTLIKESIDADVPVILHICDCTTSNWGYSTNGHYLNASGYTTDYIYLTDPYLEGHGISSGKYLVTKLNLYNVCDRMAVDVS